MRSTQRFKTKKKNYRGLGRLRYKDSDRRHLETKNQNKDTKKLIEEREGNVWVLFLFVCAKKCVRETAPRGWSRKDRKRITEIYETKS